MIKAPPNTKKTNQPPEDYKNSRPNKINLKAASESAANLVGFINNEYCASRQRMLSEKNTQVYRTHFELVLLDLFSAFSSHPKLWIGYSRGKGNFIDGGRYYNPYTSANPVTQKPFINTINFLANFGYVENWISNSGYSKISSRMRATEQLQRYFEQFGLNWTSIREDSEAPVILVKNDGKIVPYPHEEDFPLENAIESIRRVNANLQGAYLNLDISDVTFKGLQDRLLAKKDADNFENDHREPIDFSKKQLKRIFANGTFQDGGRIYGGWWQHVPSELRKHVEIDGNMVVELDFSTMAPRVLYAQVGEEAPADSYTLEGWDDSLRPIIKKAFNQLLNSKEASRNQNQWHRFAPDIEIEKDRSDLDNHEIRKLCNIEFKNKHGRPYSNLLSDLMNKHSAIDHLFFTSRWTEMQRIDSDIAETVLTKLLNKDPPITALPIHDSFIVRRGAEDDLRNAMSEAFYELTEVRPKIDKDEAVFDPEKEKAYYPIISGPEIHDETRQHMLDHSLYHKREGEWLETHGLETFD
ncbi:hypothetical protein AB9F29_03850 [Falsihalocynthiibacter sp. S25ZX9]